MSGLNMVDVYFEASKLESYSCESVQKRKQEHSPWPIEIYDGQVKVRTIQK